MHLKWFSDGFWKNDAEKKIDELRYILKNERSLIWLYQKKYQSSVIEKDPFTWRDAPTSAQIQHAKKNLHIIIDEINEEIEQIKTSEKVRTLTNRFIDWINSILKSSK